MRNFTTFKSSLIGSGLIPLTLVSTGKSRTISGGVTNEQNGEPLPSASILERTTNAVMTGTGCITDGLK